MFSYKGSNSILLQFEQIYSTADKPFVLFLEQPSTFEGIVFTHSDVKPGMVVKAKVIAVDSFGTIVQLGSGVKALWPLRHMSELEIAKPRKKFQVFSKLYLKYLKKNLLIMLVKLL